MYCQLLFGRIFNRRFYQLPTCFYSQPLTPSKPVVPMVIILQKSVFKSSCGLKIIYSPLACGFGSAQPGAPSHRRNQCCIFNARVFQLNRRLSEVEGTDSVRYKSQNFILNAILFLGISTSVTFTCTF